MLNQMGRHFSEQFPISVLTENQNKLLPISLSQIIMLVRNIGKIKTLLFETHQPFQNAYRNSQYKSKANPFQFKSLHELDKMLDSFSLQRNNANASELILKAVTDRVASCNTKLKEQDRLVDKSTIVNKCLSLTFSHIQEIGFQGLFYITEVFRCFQDSKSVRIEEKNYRFFIEKFPQKICGLLSQETNQENMNQLCQILFNLIQIRKKGILLNKLIYFIVDHGLDQKNQILQFLGKLLHFNQYRTQFRSIEKLVKRYIDSLLLSTQNSDTSVQDYNSIILETIKNSELVFKPIYYTHIKDYVCWLEKQMKKNSKLINVYTKIRICTEVVNYFQYLPAHILQQENSKEHLEFMQWLFLNIYEDIRSLQTLALSEIPNIIKAIASYESLAQIDLWGAPIRYLKQSQDLSNMLGLKIIQFAPHFDPEQTVALINEFGFSGLKIDQEVEDKFIQFSLSFLETLNFSKLLLPTIRIFQFITCKIIESKKETHIPKMTALLKKIEKTANNLRSYEMIRLHAISANLNIQTPQIQEFFQFEKQSNEAQTVENLSRTILRKHALPIILQICEKAIVKFENAPKYKLNKCNIISVSLRGSKLDQDNQNDEMFKFWFQTHWDFTKSVFNREGPAQYMIRFINKELTKSYFFNPLKFQLQIQAFHIYRSQISNSEQLNNIQENFQELLRPLLRLQRYISPGSSQRYSFFPKLAWFYKLNFGKIKTSREFHRFKSVIKQLIVFAREEKSIDTCHFHSLNKSLILSIVKQKIDETAEGLSSLLLQFWFWANHNSLLDSDPMFQSHQQENFNHCFSINKKIGSEFEILEFSLGNSQLLSNQLIEVTEGISPSWKWYESLHGRISNDVNSEDAINLLGFRNIIKYFDQKNPKFMDFLIKKIIQVDYYVGYMAYLQAWKLENSLEKKLSGDFKLKLQKWLHDQLHNIKKLDASRYPEVFIKSQQYKRVESIPEEVESYISTNLRSGNYYSMNQYIEMSQICKVQDVEVLMNSLIINRALVYMAQAFPIQCFDLISHLLSLVLLKKDTHLIKKFKNEYLGVLDDLELSKISLNRKIEFVMKVKVASSLINQSIHCKISEHKNIPDESITAFIHQKQQQIIHKEGLEHYQKAKILNLCLLTNNKNYVILSDGTKKSEMELMYLKIHIPCIKCMNCNQFILQDSLSVSL